MIESIRFGVEVEFTGLTELAAAVVVNQVIRGTRVGQSVTARDGRVWQVVRDGSVRSPGGELVTPILGMEDLNTLRQVVRALRAAGAYADPTCGIHVHVDGAEFTPNALRSLLRMVYRQENIIEKAFGIEQGRRQVFCRPVSQLLIDRLATKGTLTREALAKAWYGGPAANLRKYHDTRYSGVNLHSYFYRGTVEFRWFNGSLNDGEVAANVIFCLSLADKALKSKSAAAGAQRAYDPRSARYDFRVFLLGLGMIGDGFREARRHLLARLPGDAAWKTAEQRQAAAEARS
jgi:hypothetical protein